MKDDPTITFTSNNGHVTVLRPGDSVTFEGGTFLAYYGGKEAEAMKMLIEERQRHIREAIEFVKNQLIAQNSPASEGTIPAE